MTPESPTEPTQPMLLIAAHDPNHSNALQELVQALRPRLRTSTYREGDEAMAAAPDMAMVFEHSQEEIGEQSRKVRALYPDASLIVIAPRFDERAIDVVAALDATAIVNSPCEPAAVLRVLKSLEREVRFAGRCAAVHIADLLWLHARAASDGVLHLASAERSGAIHLEDGQPVHAHCGALRGEDAVREMLDWTGVDATWIDGRSAGPRTIAGRIEGLLERDLGDDRAKQTLVEDAPHDVLQRLEHLAGIEDILGAFLLRNTEVLIGRNDPSLDEVVVGRALSQLARVFHDMETQQGDRAGSEIQATVGDHRLVVDRVGPASLGFQVGVVVRQATPVCKSLRRLLRQLDRSFRKSLAARSRHAGAAGGQSNSAARQSAGLHRVA